MSWTHATDITVHTNIATQNINHLLQQDAVTDGRLSPRCCHLANSGVVFHSGRLTARYQNMTSSTKLKYMTYCYRPQVTRAEHLVKFGRVVFEICKQTVKQTDTLITILCTPNGGELNERKMVKIHEVHATIIISVSAVIFRITLHSLSHYLSWKRTCG